MNDKIDGLLKEALTPSKKPDARLNQDILRRAMEDNNMKKPFFRTVPVMAAVLTAVLATGSLTAYGAWKYLNPEQVAEEFGDKQLANAFKEEGAVNINESQEYGDYKITLMGTVSGNKLSAYTTESDGVMLTDRTYSVISIEKKDGSAMPDVSEDGYKEFLASPFIKGENPVFCNIFYMGGGSSTFTKDGVQYKLIDHDNIEVFAGRGVYLGVLDNPFYDNSAYNYDETTGEITRNENYKGLNALFKLPLDMSKADEEAAKKQIEKWNKDLEDNNDEDSTSMENSTDKWDWEKLKKEGTLIKGTVKKYTAPDFNEPIKYSTDVKWNGTKLGEMMFLPNAYFEKDEYGTKIVGMSTNNNGKWIFNVVKHSKDGTITVCMYHN